ncbi:MAG: NAD-dependent epimerase/dehydratase family protein [Saprospirales bacterium]|nr:NAD-dependent epimerase/dehydratase family protein [Saprospirales bacterium]MBK8491640.1 NAD-dependent epimerase/dehydratase family protein [Saprospirales bacterium]
MKYLVTGANGYIGTHLVHALLQHGHSVNAFILQGTDTSKLLHPGITLFEGDILSYPDVARSAAGCDAAFHLASIVSPWEENPKIFHRINVLGTQTLLRACRYQDVRRVLVSSSCGIFGPSRNGRMVDEQTDNLANLHEPYELSKYHQMEVAKNFLDEGLEILIAYPTRVYGPGLKSYGNSLTAIIEGTLNGTWRIIPGTGKSYGNYVFVEDVVKGMILMMDKGKSGEGYILGGQNATYNELFDILQHISGRNLNLFRIPPFLMRLLGKGGEFLARWTHRRPLLTVHGAEKFTTDWLVSTRKSREDLGFRPISLEEGMRRTVDGIQEVPQRWPELQPKHAST